MEDEQYLALLNYSLRGSYPFSYSKSKKFVLRRASKKFKVKEGKLYYIDPKSKIERLVLRGKNDVERVFSECHLLSCGGHRGRDGTLSKIKDRYYWPNYYKEIEEKVCKLFPK